MRKAIAGIFLVVLILGAPVLAQDLCDDSFRTEVEGGALTVHHLGALYNCCPEPFAYDVSQEGDLITIRETEVLENPCYCICCFNLAVVVEDVMPGSWTVVFHWYDYETQLCQEQELPVVVPDAGQSGTLHVASAENSGCLGLSAVPDTGQQAPPPRASLGTLKGIYR
jgi:hypothetical protein